MNSCMWTICFLLLPRNLLILCYFYSIYSKVLRCGECHDFLQYKCVAFWKYVVVLVGLPAVCLLVPSATKEMCKRHALSVLLLLWFDHGFVSFLRKCGVFRYLF